MQQTTSQGINNVSQSKIKNQENILEINQQHLLNERSDMKQEKKKKKKLDIFTLKYVNEEINNRYKNEQHKIKQQTLKLVLFYQVIINIIYMIISITNMQQKIGEILSYGIFIFLFILLIIYMNVFKKMSQVNDLLFIILLAYIIITNAVSYNTQQSRRIDISFLHIFPIFFVLDNWIKSSFLLLASILNEYSFHSNLFEQDKIPLIIIFPVFLAIVYLNQKKSKLLFYDYFYQQKTLAASQKLLEHTLPCSVIVLSSNEEFDNSPFNKHFLTKLKSEQHIDANTEKEFQQYNLNNIFNRPSVNSFQRQGFQKNSIKLKKSHSQLGQLHMGKDKSISQNKKQLKFEINNNIFTQSNHQDMKDNLENQQISEDLQQIQLKLFKNDQSPHDCNIQASYINPQSQVQNDGINNNIQINFNNELNDNNNNNNNNNQIISDINYINNGGNPQVNNNNYNYVNSKNSSHTINKNHFNNNLNSITNYINSKTNINENVVLNTLNRLPSKKNSQIQSSQQQIQLKVNFVNNTCLNTFRIKKNEQSGGDENFGRKDFIRQDFQEPEELQHEIFNLLSLIEVQTSEYSMNKSNMQQFGIKQNLSQFMLGNSVYNQNIYGMPINDFSENINSLVNSKKIIISTSLLDIINQKYNLLHQKYIHQKCCNNDHYNQKVNQDNQKLKNNCTAKCFQAEDKYKNIDLEKEDVFINCVYKNQKNAKALDIHIVEFQWIDEPAIMIVMTDISQQVRARRLQDLDSYKNELLATVTHDLKTPLNGMLSILEVAQELTDIHEIKNLIQIVHKNGILLNFLIMDILDYSAIIKGEMRLIQQKFDIEDILHDINDLIGFQAQQKNLKFNIQNHLSRQDRVIENDGRRIKQILLNLTSNALKFTFVGEIVIVIKKEILTDDLIKITVKDTGVGIPDTLKPKLFKLYGTYDHNNGSNKHGVGLGLVITKKLASQVGPKDSLRFQSKEKIGTEFSFHIYRNLKSKSTNQKNQIYDSPTSISKLNKNQSNISLNPTTTDKLQSNFEQQILSHKKERPFQFKENEYLESSPLSNPLSNDQNILSVQRQQSDIKNSQIINTNENFDTEVPFITPRLQQFNNYLQLNSPNQFQKSKYSHFMQYQLANSLNIKEEVDTKNQQNSSRRISEELNKNNNNLDTCVKVTESFEGKENSNQEDLDKIPTTNSNFEEKDQENIQDIQNTQNYDQQEQQLNKKFTINKNRRTKSSFSQLQDIKEFKDGEVMNIPRCQQGNQNSLELIQLPPSLQFTMPTRVLIVDDTYFNIIALKLMLKSIKNLTIEEAYNGQQALDILNQAKLSYQKGQRKIEDLFQIIFMDINMPIMDGIECTVNIRKDPFYQDVKIIAVTAYSSASESQKCFDAGMDAHICKPISRSDCFSVLLNLNQQ
ncbi:ATPase, histidine kinase-, DNA gyrase B (macronuclear) [Tetrahymena thermophila SB210]|uniref:ATPase, histidine kinase-, DNA gyrase B n=1 Tax=Tetrahymena thermophila (strain SB210) TaxID=312017 RepID=Q24D14_TETTS|nr:ATPase, histidine kinase-, DNA gyrase B [Tetrahymena thermophila SB210]EAS05594.3 ATPase, histidine kinase-, DNA gyrase B [Tetrahymena thermophila SB210]|eukprot:XP_001025839.3 ATPase, histidine kinase-, DNA gyrase B [Tetrahymena thermophila SB210]